MAVAVGAGASRTASPPGPDTRSQREDPACQSVPGERTKKSEEWRWKDGRLGHQAPDSRSRCRDKPDGSTGQGSTAGHSRNPPARPVSMRRSQRVRRAVRACTTATGRLRSSAPATAANSRSCTAARPGSGQLGRRLFVVSVRLGGEWVYE